MRSSTGIEWRQESHWTVRIFLTHPLPPCQPLPSPQDLALSPTTSCRTVNTKTYQRTPLPIGHTHDHHHPHTHELPHDLHYTHEMPYHWRYERHYEQRYERHYEQGRHHHYEQDHADATRRRVRLGTRWGLGLGASPQAIGSG